MKIVALLQNPYSPIYAGRFWTRKFWLAALRKSRSGQRLKIFDDLDIYYDNASPIVAPDPHIVYKPDLKHIRSILNTQKPEIIITFGKHAFDGVKQAVNGLNCYSVLALPHPTYRVLTNALYMKARKLLLNGFNGVIELKQRKGKIEIKKWRIT